jgi:hypothetical protein
MTLQPRRPAQISHCNRNLRSQLQMHPVFVSVFTSCQEDFKIILCLQKVLTFYRSKTAKQYSSFPLSQTSCRLYFYITNINIIITTASTAAAANETTSMSAIFAFHSPLKCLWVLFCKLFGTVNCYSVNLSDLSITSVRFAFVFFHTFHMRM